MHTVHTVYTNSTPKVKEEKVEHHLLVLTLIYSTYMYIQIGNYRAKMMLTYIHTYIQYIQYLFLSLSLKQSISSLAPVQNAFVSSPFTYSIKPTKDVHYMYVCMYVCMYTYVCTMYACMYVCML